MTGCERFRALDDRGGSAVQRDHDGSHTHLQPGGAGRFLPRNLVEDEMLSVTDWPSRRFSVIDEAVAAVTLPRSMS